MDAICGPLQGFCNAIVYGINQKLRERYIECCKTKKEDLPDVDRADYAALEAEYDFKYPNYGSNGNHRPQRQSLPESPGF